MKNIVRYAITSLVLAAAACSSDPLEEATGSSSNGLALSLSTAEETWVGYVATNVVPHLTGTLDERAHRAAIVTWWALKEGVLDVSPSPFHHDLCASGATQSQIGPLATCSGPWQVGIAGMFMGNVSDAQVAAAAAAVHPGVSLTTLLGTIAQTAGYPTTSSTGQQIVASSGRLRSAWLVRDGAIGITLNEPFVAECFTTAPDWCFGTWSEATRFASSAARIKDVVGQLETRFKAAPATPGGTPSGGGSPAVDLCAGATFGNGGYCAISLAASADPKALLTCNDGKTAETVTCANGCQRMADGLDDVCAAAPPSDARAAMIQRARAWADIDMPYCGGVPGGPDLICGGTCTQRAGKFSQPAWNAYRSDCSGFVSYVWQLTYDNGHRTWGFAPFNEEGPAFSKVIAAADLQPGDALNTATADKQEQHIMLFAGWADTGARIAHTIEEANCTDDVIETQRRAMTFNADGTVMVAGDARAFWPIRKSGL
jgi:hypothetical protein